MKKDVEVMLGAVFGTKKARSERRAIRVSPRTISDGIAEYERRYGGAGPESKDSPVFVFSAGWRSGSTLVQRLLTSGNKTLIWGEPYHHAGLVERLAASMKSFTPDWPSENDFFSERSDDLSSQWIANLYPGLNHLKWSHLAFFDRLFAEPARRNGYERWGIKTVWLNIEHAKYLRWLYPKSRLLFLYRNPMDAYGSYRSRGHRNWYITWPDEPVHTPTVYGRLWTDILSGYLRYVSETESKLIKFEDLIGGEVDLDDLGRYLETDIDPSILRTKVGSSKKPGQAEVWLPWIDRQLLKRQVGRLAKELGYIC